MIYSRGNMKWYRFKWTITLTDGTKERHLIQKSARTKNKRKAEEVEEEHKRALRLGQIHPRDPWPKPIAPQAPAVREFAERFKEYVKLHTKPGTATFYAGAVERILRFAPLADSLLSGNLGEQVAKYTQWRRAQASGNSIPTVNGELRTLRRMFSLAEEWGILDRAPAIHELPGEKGRDRVLSYAEEAAYLLHASDALHDLAILAVDTGLRPNSELFPLEWSNVHLEPTTKEPHGYIHVPRGKTDYAVRNVPLTARSRKVLASRLETRTGKFVFPGEGKKGHIVTIQHTHERTMRDAKLQTFEFYCWRHTYGTRCAESEMDKHSLARLMGHSSPRVTERYYIHVTESHVAAGFDRFNAYHTAKLAELPVTAATI